MSDESLLILNARQTEKEKNFRAAPLFYFTTRQKPSMEFIRLLRLYQHTKNLFIFLPLFFAGEFFNISKLAYAGWSFVAFSLTASSVYIFNDCADREEDVQHPSKKFRPIACGKVSVHAALLLMSALFAASMAVFYFCLGLETLFIALFYFLLNILYSLKLKTIPIADIFTIASGFVVRLLVGSSATGIPLSVWIISMTFLLALFLALGKRRDDVLIYEKEGRSTRKAIGGYNLKFVDSAMTAMSSVIIVFYTLYTVSPETIEKFNTGNLYITAIFVLYGIFRYKQITLVMEQSGNPAKILLKDRPIQLALIGWFSAFSYIIY